MRQVVCVLFSVALSIVLMSCAGEDFDGLTFKSINANDEDSVEHPTLESYIKDSRQISDSRYVSFLNPNEKGSLDTVVILTNQEHVLYLKEGSFYYRGSGCSDSNVVAENDTLFVNYSDDKKMDYLPYQKIPLLDTGVLKKILSVVDKEVDGVLSDTIISSYRLDAVSFIDGLEFVESTSVVDYMYDPCRYFYEIPAPLESYKYYLFNKGNVKLPKNTVVDWILKYTDQYGRSDSLALTTTFK